tara:strand:- start:1003 stop:1725 length:723 start_codon:yes stop_codon:yes gene_type:complete
MEWKPSKDDIESTREELSALPAGAIWALPNNHAVFRREGEEEKLVLLQKMTHPAIEEGIGRIVTVCKEINWEVDLEQAEELPFETTSPEEMIYQERIRRQEILMRATCSNHECDTLLVGMDLENPNWTHIRDAQMEGEEGELHDIEIWSPVITCYECGEQIKMMPEDYAILAGDDLATRYKTGTGIEYRVLSRDEIIHLVDQREMQNVTILGTVCPMSNEVVPPHFRALVTQFTLPDEEE